MWGFKNHTPRTKSHLFTCLRTYLYYIYVLFYLYWRTYLPTIFTSFSTSIYGTDYLFSDRLSYLWLTYYSAKVGRPNLPTYGRPLPSGYNRKTLYFSDIFQLIIQTFFDNQKLFTNNIFSQNLLNFLPLFLVLRLLLSFLFHVDQPQQKEEEEEGSRKKTKLWKTFFSPQMFPFNESLVIVTKLFKC